jgi:hypothetical protein
MYIILHNVERNLILLHDSQTSLIKAATLTILTFVLYGCKTWVSHTNASPRVFGNTVLRKMHWSTMNEVIGEWRKLHNEELCNIYPHQTLLGQPHKEG